MAREVCLILNDVLDMSHIKQFWRSRSNPPYCGSGRFGDSERACPIVSGADRQTAKCHARSIGIGGVETHESVDQSMVGAIASDSNHARQSSGARFIEMRRDFVRTFGYGNNQLAKRIPQ